MWVEDGCLVGLGKVDGLVPGVISSVPILRDPVPDMGHALDGGLHGLSQHIVVFAQRELGRLLAEVALAADGGVLLVQAPGEKKICQLRRRQIDENW